MSEPNAPTPFAATPAPAAPPAANLFDVASESLGFVAQNAGQIAAVTRMSSRSQATFALTLGLFGSLFSVLSHLHRPAA